MSTPLMTSNQLDLSPFTTTHCARQFRPFFYPVKSTPMQTTSSCGEEEIVGNSAIGLIKDLIDDIHSLSLIH